MGAVKLSGEHTVGRKVHHAILRQFPARTEPFDLALRRLSSEPDVTTVRLHILGHGAEFLSGLGQGSLHLDVRHVGQGAPRLNAEDNSPMSNDRGHPLRAPIRTALVLSGEPCSVREAGIRSVQQRVAAANHRL